jgi:phage-related protein
MSHAKNGTPDSSAALDSLQSAGLPGISTTSAGQSRFRAVAQTGQHPPSAKPLKGLGGGTVELVEDFDGDTYRAVYTVRFSEAVYVLHAFKKKSKRGIKTPQRDIDLIVRRLKDAEHDHDQRFKKENK